MNDNSRQSVKAYFDGIAAKDMSQVPWAKDATLRATQIVSNANGSLGKLVEARMGVMQINPKGVTQVSDTGNNDTSSLEKEILAVVTVRFELR